MLTGPERTILLVEDNEDDIFFMQRAFKQVGITNPIRVVEDGQAALDYLEGKGQFTDRDKFPFPYLILLDLKLPKVMGLDVLKRIRTNPALPSFLVVVLTSSSEQSDVQRAYRLGANSYLIKPANAERLVNLVKCLGEYWFDWNTRPPA
jgi:CheY-like chemotaxis protein